MLVQGSRLPAAVYQPSARRLDERIKPRLYPLGAEIKRVDSAGFISLEGGRGYVGEAFIGVDVALERSEKLRLDPSALCQCEARPARHVRQAEAAARVFRQGLGMQTSGTDC